MIRKFSILRPGRAMGRKAETSTRLPQRAERATGFGSPDADRPHWDVPSHWRNA